LGNDEKSEVPQENFDEKSTKTTEREKEIVLEK